MSGSEDDVTTNAESDGNRLDAELRWLGYALLVVFVVFSLLCLSGIAIIFNL